MKGRVALAAAAIGAALLLAGCAGSGSGASPSSAPAKTSAPPTPQTLTVFAATSLTATFNTLGKAFEDANPGVTVQYSYNGTSTLVTQLSQGAPADILASADEKNMQNAVSQNLISGTPVDFATNVLEIAVAPGNPKNITGWADLAKPGLKVDVCADGVPCGNATEAVEKATGTTLKPISQEQNVGDVLAKVESGDADAGVVYVTDVKGAGSKVTGVDFPEAQQAINTYPIAATASSKNAALAKKFIAYVTGSAGQKLLKDAGFGAPPK
ncbi:molybdate ABC transporter substrate-binding protein [Gryllotalpicola protaetiae]|uniref:Molybdate ABC transporter substrate-binding protein n=1 Tax=Gryllotalpicola protaetiae TaxID=2419771 RepID=A0A387BFL1_9MICO|nr:molybdate ABC transporter substrate-binding protein [Gryllotalpicola protaetiae]AYG02805.1 molybdate ABC transporter substrate-binding protein [Gryllotalpicola protaetiae]